jgi:hypothetical protein
MLRKTLVAAAAAALLAPPAALAGPPATSDCSFQSVAQEQATGGVYEGAAAGYVVAGPADTVAVSCVLYVNGTRVATTPTGTGVGAAATAGRLTFAAGDTDVVHLCRVVTVNGSTEEICFDHYDPYPWWLLDELWPDPTVLDPAVCPVLASLAGEYGPVTVNGQGDVFVAGEPQWDCPPYDIWPLS